MPSIIAALPIGLIGGQRRRFTWGNSICRPGAMIVLSHVMVWIVSHLQAMPLVYVGAMWLTYFLCFLMILRTGAQLGMLIIIIAVLVSVMGLNSIAAAEAMRDGFTQASLLSLVLGRLVHALLPARTAELHVRDPQPAPGNVGVGAAIRASLLLLVSLWLYTVLQPSDIMLAMITAMVLVFPTGKAALAEANERVLVTLYGGAMTAVVPRGPPADPSLYRQRRLCRLRRALPGRIPGADVAGNRDRVFGAAVCGVRARLQGSAAEGPLEPLLGIH